eukprot:345380_1
MVLDSVSIINISNITHHWITLQHTLTSPNYYMRCVVHNDLIYVVGGGNDYPINETDKVDVIDTKSFSIQSDSKLVQKTRSTSLVKLNSTLYAIGGTPYYNTYQYAMLDILFPTSNPNFDPTSVPTDIPTLPLNINITSIVIFVQIDYSVYNMSIDIE